jgi:hypothetical protein
LLAVAKKASEGVKKRVKKYFALSGKKAQQKKGLSVFV